MWVTGGSRQSGSSGFTCCSKDSVDIIESHVKNSQHSQRTKEDMEAELEQELLALEPMPCDEFDPELEVELKPLVFEVEEELESASLVQVESVSLVQEDTALEESQDQKPEQWEVKVEPLLPLTGELEQDILRWSIKSNSSFLSAGEEDPSAANQRSISIQTSRHLFWVDKLAQASEHSLDRALLQLKNESKDKPSGHHVQILLPKNLNGATSQRAHPDTQSQKPPPYSLPPSQPPISLEELINFATSLAMASSNNMNLRSLENFFKIPLQKAVEPPSHPTVKYAPEPIREQLKQEKSPRESPKEPLKKTLESEFQKAWPGGNKNFLYPYFDFNKPGMKATIKGEMKFLQPLQLSSLSPEARADPVPETRKQNPLLLKIHFRLSTPSSPEK